MKHTVSTAAAVLLVVSLGTGQTVSAETTLCTARGNVDQKYVDEVNRLLGAVPEELLQQFEDNGWTIEVNYPVMNYRACKDIVF